MEELLALMPKLREACKEKKRVTTQVQEVPTKQPEDMELARLVEVNLGSLRDCPVVKKEIDRARHSLAWIAQDPVTQYLEDQEEKEREKQVFVAKESESL